MERITLFCLPFAGGNKYSYRAFLKEAKGLLKIVPLEYPGRGGRMNESLETNIDRLVDDAYRQVKYISGLTEYAIYGHSMGGLVAWLLARKIVENGCRKPMHIFISGTIGPAACRVMDKKRHLLEKSAFFAEIRDLNGSPEAVLQNADLMDHLEPILRADFEATETFIYTEATPLRIPFSVITGTEEDMEMDDIMSWQKETTYPVNFLRMSGGHFFIYEHAPEILNFISGKLSPPTEGSSLIFRLSGS